ncbi:hypothetical protein EV368DRAFT_87980 [Lentinula lateritia]|nr:hypothetical protein EV368DRAFT_87980 [Lentinula lateritia]
MPSSPDKTRSASPRFAAAASSSIPFEQGGVPSVVSEDDEDVDQLAFTLDAPSRPQLDFFEKVFNTGKSLASYSQDDPLWSLLSSIVAPCTNCLKAPDTCVVLPGSPRCLNCSSKKTCSLGKILRFRYFARQRNQDLAYSCRFLELHDTPAQKASWAIPVDLWCCKTWVRIGLRVGFGMMGLCCSVLGAGWSSKGATETATEDGNDLVVVGVRRCDP